MTWDRLDGRVRAERRQRNSRFRCGDRRGCVVGRPQPSKHDCESEDAPGPGSCADPRQAHEVVEATGLSKGTTHRILATLVERQFINLAPDGSYLPGRRTFSLSGPPLARSDFLPSRNRSRKSWWVESSAQFLRVPGSHRNNQIRPEHLQRHPGAHDPAGRGRGTERSWGGGTNLRSPEASVGWRSGWKKRSRE